MSFMNWGYIKIFKIFSNMKNVGIKPTFFILVAGPGLEPGSGGYAYHYNFSCSNRSLIWGLDYTFIFWFPKSDTYHLVSTPSLIIYIRVWLGIAMSSFCKRTKVSPNLARIPLRISAYEPS